MFRITLRAPRTALTAFGIVLLAVAALVGWRQAMRVIYPSTLVADRAYEASEECVRQIAAHKDSLLFAGLGIDPGAASHLRTDGNYESSGWVEEMNEYGHRDHKDWHCVLHYSRENNWSVIYLQIGKHTEGTYVPE